ncbi:ABC transporter permease [Salinicoccus sp. ID82-1]|uniref:ABC transporter permease n=1 Tax=Salinicoccus cyprini TaxID=2493691 RepID=A0A558AU50_9STAP|nr:MULTISPECIES: ABC transporter permease [Salinicoccus]MCG1010811.1 ABC transporter permease [Salinicoccus sp. ID82-1]TVT27706.1 ABC transporter permease [Salinicoccus cyprini]
MSKFLATFSQTYLSKVRAKSFMISTLIIVLLIFIGANFDKIIGIFDSSEELTTIKVEGNEAVAAQFETVFNALETDISVSENDGELGEGEALLTIEETEPMTFTIEADQEIPGDQMSDIEMALGEVQRSATIQSLNLSPEEAQRLNATPDITYDIASAAGDPEEEEATASEGDGMPDINILNMVVFYVTVIVMFFIIINYASQIGTEVAMEKTSRVIEMIVSSVPPVTHLLAKITAMISVSLTQLAIFLIAIFAAIQLFDFSDLISEFGLEANDQTATMIVYSFIYLILGLILYLSISAMLGSFISRMEDLQQALLPVTMFSLIGFYIAIFNLWGSADNLLVRISSYFPLFTPFVMPLRAMNEETGQMPLLIGVAILLVSIALAIWLAASVYRNSVLSTSNGIFKNLKRVRKE